MVGLFGSLASGFRRPEAKVSDAGSLGWSAPGLGALKSPKPLLHLKLLVDREHDSVCYHVSVGI